MKNTPKKRGFTLIELLVVIAIIAILAAILFPVFARARENARRASCQSNLKQIGLGIMQYTQDYDEFYPLQSHQSSSVVSRFWPVLIQPYVKSYQLFDCPSASMKHPNFTGNSATEYAANISYGINYWIGSRAAVMVSLSVLSRPAETIIVAEGGNKVGNNRPGYPIIYSSHYGAANTSEPTYGFNNTAPARLSDRHLEGNNVLWADGHVKWMRTDALEADQGGTASKYWWGRE